MRAESGTITPFSCTVGAVETARAGSSLMPSWSTSAESMRTTTPWLSAATRIGAMTGSSRCTSFCRSSFPFR